jgi:arylsulfatase
MKLDPEMQKRTIEFIHKNAAAKRPFYVDYWPIATSFLGFPNRLTASGGLSQAALVRLDAWIGELMTELKSLGIAENTLVILMADNGPMTHNGPPGMAETLYRGGKGDFLEGAVRVPAMAWWPGVIAPGQTVGDIIHETDLFTTFAHLAGATNYIPTDRIIDGIDQTALFLKSDTFSRRDYVFIYTGTVLAATVKGRYKRVWVGEKPGLSGAAFFDLYTDPREENGKMLPMFPAKGMFNIMRTRHQLCIDATGTAIMSFRGVFLLALHVPFAHGDCSKFVASNSTINNFLFATRTVEVPCVTVPDDRERERPVILPHLQ